MKRVAISFLLVTLVGCSTSNKPEYIMADDDPLIYMSEAKAPANCKLIGYTKGPYQTFTTGNFKLGKNLHQAHINKAQALGGNYLEKDHNNGTGKVYSCPNSELLKMEAASKQ